MKSVFKVLKYDCASCAMVMEGICEDTPGVTKAEINVGKRLLTVDHETSVSPEKLKSALEQEGYPVESVVA